MGLVQGAGQETKQRREMGLGDVRSSEGDEEQLARDGVIRKAMSTLSPPLSLALGRAEWGVVRCRGALPCVPTL